MTRECQLPSDIIRLTRGRRDGIAIDPVYGNPGHKDNHFATSESGSNFPLPCYERDTLYISRTLLDRARYIHRLIDQLSNSRYGLGIWDAWRPHAAAREMDRRCDKGFVTVGKGGRLSPGQCPTYVTDVSRGKVSGHTGKRTGDFFLADRQTGSSTHSAGFDTFSSEAHFRPSRDLEERITRFRSNPLIDGAVRSWFLSLSSEEGLYFAMRVSGMRAYPAEYWHFTMEGP